MVGIHGSQSSEGADTLLRMEPKMRRAIYTPKAGEEGADCRSVKSHLGNPPNHA